MKKLVNANYNATPSDKVKHEISDNGVILPRLFL
jgi:hypothetical protein